MSRFVLVMLTVTLCAFAGWTARRTRVTVLHASRVSWDTPFLLSPAGDHAPLDAPRSEEPEERPDLYGNHVSNAVASYTYDRAGTVYEEHSPQTEVPRLRPPTS